MKYLYGEFLAKNQVASRISMKERHEINQTVESLFPHTAPTPPPRRKSSKLSNRKNKDLTR